jgi:hypothetical protein
MRVGEMSDPFEDTKPRTVCYNNLLINTQTDM